MSSGRHKLNATQLSLGMNSEFGRRSVQLSRHLLTKALRNFVPIHLRERVYRLCTLKEILRYFVGDIKSCAIGGTQWYFRIISSFMSFKMLNSSPSQRVAE